jgi:hypothetical protein
MRTGLILQQEIEDLAIRHAVEHGRESISDADLIAATRAVEHRLIMKRLRRRNFHYLTHPAYLAPKET